MTNSLAHINQGDLYFLGDVHGRFDRVARLLKLAGLERGVPLNTTLVQIGDIVDRGREDERLVERLSSACMPQGDFEIIGPETDDQLVDLRAVFDGTAPWTQSVLHQERVALLGALDTVQAIRGFMALERQSAGRVVCLLGNHDLDLLFGNYYYFRRQKSYVLALLGVPPELAARHALVGLPLANLTNAAPELAWLAARPFIAEGEGIIAVHGGPTRALVDSFQDLGINNLAQLCSWLEAARHGSRDHDAFREGDSLFSPDKPEDDVVFDADLRTRFLGLANAKMLAVGHSPYLHAKKGTWVEADDPLLGPSIERPAILADGQVLKLDTGMKRAGPAWLVQRVNGLWSTLREDGEAGSLTDPHRAAISPPIPGDMEKRLYAVHGTNSLPSDGRLLAGVRGDRPSFRPGPHFSLGSLSEGMISSVTYQFAILIPLGQLASQLINVSPMDTFVIGDVRLPNESIVLIPEGTDLSNFSSNGRVRPYSIQKGLRRSVQEAIEEQRGWAVALPADFDMDSSATIHGIEINCIRFFELFLDSHRHVSFGGHSSSEVGCAGIIGMIDRLIQGLTKQYAPEATHVLSRRRTVFFSSIVWHYLAWVDRWVAERQFIEIDGYVREACKVRRWLRFINADVQIRNQLGKTLARAPQSVLECAYALADDSTALESMLAQKADILPECRDSSDLLEVSFVGEVFSVLPREEFKRLLDATAEHLVGTSIPEIQLSYAVRRWLTIKTSNAMLERLNILIVDALPKVRRDIESLCQIIGPPVRNQTEEVNAILHLLEIEQTQRLALFPERRAEELTVRFKNLGM